MTDPGLLTCRTMPTAPSASAWWTDRVRKSLSTGSINPLTFTIATEGTLGDAVAVRWTAATPCRARCNDGENPADQQRGRRDDGR